MESEWRWDNLVDERDRLREAVLHVITVGVPLYAQAVIVGDTFDGPTTAISVIDHVAEAFHALRDRTCEWTLDTGENWRRGCDGKLELWKYGLFCHNCGGKVIMKWV